MPSKVVLDNSTHFYLYGNPSILSQLKKGVLPLSTDFSMFEPYLSYDNWYQGKTSPVTEQEFQRGLEQEYKKLPENVKMFLSFVDFSKQSDKLAESIKGKILRTRTTNLKGFDRSRIEKSAYMRLFPVATSDFAWRRLAGNYSGLCLAISSKAQLFTSGTGKPVSLQAVKYGQKHALAVDKNTPVPGLFDHSAEYALQKEWRAAYVASLYPNSEIKITKNDLRGIYVPSTAPASLLNQVKNLVKQDLRYRHVDLFEVFPDASQWRLSARKMSVTG